MPIHFSQAINGVRLPEPADETVGGSLPGDACWSARQASARGWYCYAPVDFEFEWNGTRGLDVWINGEALGQLDLGGAVDHPVWASAWDASAPDHLRGELYPILSRSPLSYHMIQVWTGLLIDVSPGWLAEIRPVVNRPWPYGYYVHSGLFASAGPLFVTIALLHMGRRLSIFKYDPLCQVQALPREALKQRMTSTRFADWTAADWDRYEQTVVLPSRARASAARQ